MKRVIFQINIPEEGIFTYYDDFTYRVARWSEGQYSEWKLDPNTGLLLYRHEGNVEWSCEGIHNREKRSKLLKEALLNYCIESDVL